MNNCDKDRWITIIIDVFPNNASQYNFALCMDIYWKGNLYRPNGVGGNIDKSVIVKIYDLLVLYIFCSPSI